MGEDGEDGEKREMQRNYGDGEEEVNGLTNLLLKLLVKLLVIEFFIPSIVWLSISSDSYAHSLFFSSALFCSIPIHKYAP